MAAAVEFSHISKFYETSNVLALDDVSFPIEEGKILCLAGENGAGKSTLMKILSGMESPTTGSLKVHGSPASCLTPAKAASLGIGMLHQNLMGIEDFTVEENALLGHEKTLWKVFVDRRRTRIAVREAIERFGFDLKPDQRIRDLSVGLRQQAEILKLLINGARILILDEPTAVLASEGIRRLFKDLGNLAAQGRTVILITHSLAEIKKISDTVAVLRGGRLVGLFPTSSKSEEETSLLMFGKAVQDLSPRGRQPGRRLAQRRLGRTVLSCQGISVSKKSMDRLLLDRVSFDVHAGEILGFGALPGNGLGVLEGVLGGFIRTSAGTTFLDGNDITGISTKKLRKLGLAYVPSSKMGMGTNPAASAKENLIPLEIGKLSKGPFLLQRRIRAFAEQRLRIFDVAARAEDRAATLSGGNIQKLVLAREMPFCRALIVFSQPLWGLDEEASAFVKGKILKLRDDGAAVVLLSYSLDDVMLLSDRVGILRRGRLAGLFENGEAAKEQLGNLMVGVEG